MNSSSRDHAHSITGATPKSAAPNAESSALRIPVEFDEATLPKPGATLTLPWPPSLNSLFSDGKHRRTISKRYELWINDASAALFVQRPLRHTGPVRATLLLSPPDNRERDADNYAKAPMDLLVKAGVIKGDSKSFVRSILLAWSDAAPAKPGCVTIHLEAA